MHIYTQVFNPVGRSLIMVYGHCSIVKAIWRRHEMQGVCTWICRF